MWRLQSGGHFLRFGFALATLLMSIAVEVPARANLIITPTFDSSITNDTTNVKVIEDTIDAAITVFESTYSNPIDVLIYFQEGGGLGTSNWVPNPIGYSGFYSALVSTGANFTAVADLTANGGNSTNNPVTGTTSIDIKSANARALGINILPACIPAPATDNLGLPMECGSGTANPVDGIISLKTSSTYPPNANNGSNVGLMAVVEHEIDEVLGLGSSLQNTLANSGTVNSFDPSPEDLFRYGADGSRIFSVDCAAQTKAFFSYNGTTDLAQFNNACNNADFADWVKGTSAQVQDAFATPGADPLYGPNEIAALSAIGYTVVAPEPATWSLMLTALAALALARRRSAAEYSEPR